MCCASKLLLFVLAMLALPVAAAESLQPIAPAPLSPGNTYDFPAALKAALTNYPSIGASLAKEEAAGAHVGLVRTNYLPRVDLIVQENRSSINNAFTTFFPFIHLPIINGPLERKRSFDSVWASAAGALMSWELIDFGLRHSEVGAAKAGLMEAQASTVVTKFDVQLAAADAFIDMLATEQKVRVAQAQVDRMTVFSTAVHALVKAQLRPGVDASRADAEVALAQDQLITAEQTREVARANLAEKLGLPNAQLEVEPHPLLTLPGTDEPPPLPSFTFHPFIVRDSAAIDAVRAREKVWKRSYFPHIYFQSAMQSRGGGVNGGGALARDGYLPVIPNWSVGLTATFPAFDIFAIREHYRIACAEEKVARCRYDETMLKLRAQDARARALIDGALKLARNAPLFLKSAEDTELRAKARYKVGLSTVVDVAEAERLLTDAQVTNDLAALNVWRSFLAASVAHGDLAPFLQLVSSASGLRR